MIVVIYGIGAARNLHKSGRRVRCFNRSDLRFGASRYLASRIASIHVLQSVSVAAFSSYCRWFSLLYDIAKQCCNRKTERGTENIKYIKESSLRLMRRTAQLRGRPDDGKSDPSSSICARWGKIFDLCIACACVCVCARAHMWKYTNRWSCEEQRDARSASCIFPSFSLSSLPLNLSDHIYDLRNFNPTLQL